ncbi:MAG: hypothetical protein D6786_00775 [Gammaproteobacteria bacterium]|nr:MAG: hypothetical protein D6786_00775 [Gammaproteobacteria bacterium]
MGNTQTTGKLFLEFFSLGLGELLMLQRHEGKALLGYLVMEKGKLLFRDQGILKDVPEMAVAPCWDIGTVGAICRLEGVPWKSLSFLGPDHCRIPVDLSATRHDLLGRVTGPMGEDLLTFRGSAYRAFQAMLGAHILPVVVPQPLVTDAGVIGLAVGDLRFASIPLEAVMTAHELVEESVERHLTLSVEDLSVDEEEFEKLFGNFIHSDRA